MVDAEKLEKLAEIKKNLEESKKEFRPDDPRVTIAQMQINAIKELSTDDNQVFSQLSSQEVFDVSRAYVFAKSPLPSIEKRLKEKGIQFKFSLPILSHFLDENIRHRHKIDRKRVQEYIKGLEAVGQKNANVFADDKMRNTVMQRLF